MIVTCASCLTKFNLDDSRISDKGVKVRCSRCKHVFYVARPPETKGDVIEDLESFAKYHEELMEPNQKEMKIPSPSGVEKREMMPEEEGETAAFAEGMPTEKAEQVFPTEFEATERVETTVSKPKRMVRKERRRPSLLFVILVILILLSFGFIYLWTESGTSGKVYSLLEYPTQMITRLWEQIWRSEKEGLIVGDLNGYEERIEEVSLYVIEGKVNNQSQITKKHIKIKVAIFDQQKVKMAEKETICGHLVSREELRNLPEAFFKGEMVIRPKTEKDMITPPGKTIPFMLVFRNLSAQPREFQVEIIEAPNL